MQTAVIFIITIQVLLSTALPLDIVLPRDKRSDEVSNFKSGIQLLFQYLASEELLNCRNGIDHCSESMLEVMKTHKEGTKFLNKIDTVKGLSNALNLTTKAVIHSCSFFMKSVYSETDLFDCAPSKYRELQYKLLTLYKIFKLKKKTDNLESANVVKCEWLQERLPELNIRICA